MNGAFAQDVGDRLNSFLLLWKCPTDFTYIISSSLMQWMGTEIRFCVLLADCPFLPALAPSSRVGFASYLAFESINSFFATTLVLGSNIRPQNKSVQDSFRQCLVSFSVLFKYAIFYICKLLCMNLNICGPMSNASASCKSLRMVSQHLSLLEARGDGHWAALEKRETNSRGSCLERGKAGRVAGVLSIAMQAHTFLWCSATPDWHGRGFLTGSEGLMASYLLNLSYLAVVSVQLGSYRCKAWGITFEVWM